MECPQQDRSSRPGAKPLQETVEQQSNAAVIPPDELARQAMLSQLGSNKSSVVGTP
jgi:hypothetical protein